MDALTILIILVILIAFIVLVYFLLHFGYFDFWNARLDELTGQDANIPQTVRKALEPLTFRVANIKPNGYSHYYEIPPSSARRAIFVTCSRGFVAALDGEQMVDTLNETRYKETRSGLLFAGDQPVELEVYALDDTKPVIHLSHLQESRSPSPVSNVGDLSPAFIHW